MELKLTKNNVLIKLFQLLNFLRLEMIGNISNSMKLLLIYINFLIFIFIFLLKQIKNNEK